MEVTRDIIVIGTSAGGVEALPRILQQLPADLRAAILIVQHLAVTRAPQLASILDRVAPLPVAWAEQGAPIRRGQILIAPPDVHFLISDEHVNLSGGPRENHARPSIDKLFRSAAAAYGARVVGVLLTGMLDDGVAGLVAIRASGGIVLVQDPNTAEFPELPARALQALVPDRTLPLDAIGVALLELVGTPAIARPARAEVVLEAALDRHGPTEPKRMAQLGPQAPLSCPECHGPLWQVGTDEGPRYRCYLGHVATARDLLEQNTNEIEAALWSAVRALNDRAITLEELATDSQRIGRGTSAEHYGERAREARRQAELARQFVTDLGRTR